MIVYADTSALGSAYLGDEADGPAISAILFEGNDPVVTSELTDVELASMLARAWRDGRIEERAVSDRLAVYGAHTADDGPIGVLPLNRQTLEQARAFLLQTSIRTVDALHLASASLLAATEVQAVVVLTRDRRQAQAATALGLTLHVAAVH